ncbi:MAG TPA: chalcone isomerase family protein [Gemmatimonadales bacterium]|nr:chalcone isomerase family protein [Gemmatimonadales bacterium]
MLLALSLLLAAAPVHQPVDTSRTISGVVLPENIEVAGKTLVLNGAALRKKAIFKVYVAALYVATKSQSADAILAEDEPRRMVMHFVRNVDKDKICDAWNDGLKDNTPNAGDDVKKEFADLCGLMADIKDGEEMTFTYVPGNGTTVVVAGQEKGTVGGRDFAGALLRCWIGPKPGPGEGFKKNLLSIKN